MHSLGKRAYGGSEFPKQKLEVPVTHTKGRLAIGLWPAHLRGKRAVRGWGRTHPADLGNACKFVNTSHHKYLAIAQMSSLSMVEGYVIGSKPGLARRWCEES